MKPTTLVGIPTLAALLILAAALLALPVAGTSGTVDLTISINTPDHVAPGQLYTSNIAYANTGDAASPEDTWVVAILPKGVTFVTATDRWGAALPPDTAEEDRLAWRVGPVPPDSCCDHILISTMVSPTLPQGTVLTVTAAVTTSTTDVDPTNNEASDTSVVCDMAGSAKRVHSPQVMPGDDLTYTITISIARGIGISRTVVLTDMLPFTHQVRFLGWTGSLTGTLHDGNMLTWQGQVRAGQPLTLQYRLGVEGIVTPGVIITNGAWLGWDGWQMPLPPVTTVVTLPEWARVMGPDGGQWQNEHGITLTVAPGAVTDTTRFQFRPLFTDSVPLDTPPGWLFAHRAFDITAFRFGQEVHQFGQPITLTVGYSPTDMSGLDPATLRLWWRAGPGEQWHMLGDPVEWTHQTLAFTTTHLTQFGLFGQGTYRVFLPAVSRP